MAVLLVGLLVALWFTQSSQEEERHSGISNSEKSAQANTNYLDYVRAHNPELRGEPNGNLLVVGYKICTELHDFSELTLVNMADIQYTGAGRHIYDAATQYLCEEGR